MNDRLWFAVLLVAAPVTAWAQPPAERAAVFLGPTWLVFDGFGGTFGAVALGARALRPVGSHAAELAATLSVPSGQAEAIPACLPNADCVGRRSPSYVSTVTVAFRPDVHLERMHVTFGGGVLSAGGMRGGESWALAGVLGVEWTPRARPPGLQLSMRVFVPHRAVAGMAELFVPAIGFVF